MRPAAILETVDIAASPLAATAASGAQSASPATAVEPAPDDSYAAQPQPDAQSSAKEEDTVAGGAWLQTSLTYWREGNAPDSGSPSQGDGAAGMGRMRSSSSGFSGVDSLDESSTQMSQLTQDPTSRSRSVEAAPATPPASPIAPNGQGGSGYPTPGRPISSPHGSTGRPASVRKTVSQRTKRVNISGQPGTQGQSGRARKLHVPESILPALQQLHKMFPNVSVTAIAEDLMKTNNNMQVRDPNFV